MKKYAFYIIGAVVLCFFVINLFPFTAYYLLRVIPSNIEYVKRERSNTKIERALKNDNYNILTKWLQNQLSTIVYESVKIKYIGRKSGTNISMFDISVPFADSIEIHVDSSKQSVINKYLSFIGTKKFQHMYSEWLKKQVGIDDENVEFGFAGNFDTPYIEFDKITSLSDDYKEIFENTHNLYCNKCYINNLFELNEENAKVIADELRNKYLFNASKITGMPQEKKISGHIYMSTNAFNSGAGIDFAFIFDLHNFSSELNIF